MKRLAVLRIETEPVLITRDRFPPAATEVRAFRVGLGSEDAIARGEEPTGFPGRHVSGTGMTEMASDVPDMSVINPARIERGAGPFASDASRADAPLTVLRDERQS